MRRSLLTSSFLAATALVFSTSAFAQEESASPEEKASVSIEATSEPTPAATEKSGESAVTPKPVESTSSIWDETPSPSASPSRKPSPRPKAKVAAPANAATPAKAPAPPAPIATPAPAKPGKKTNVEASLKEMENKWEASIPNHDTASIEPLIAADYAGVSSKGKFTNKALMLSELKADPDKYNSAKNEKLNVHFYGPSVAVVTGTAREKGTATDGKPFDRNYRFTDTWVERDGQWQCVASHSALFSAK